MRKSKVISRCMLLIAVVLVTTTVSAQHDHSSHGTSHTTTVKIPPHGGTIKKAGRYWIEMVTNMMLKKDQLTFYILKGNFKTIPNIGITGQITMTNEDGKVDTQPLQARGEEFFVAQLNNSSSFRATVEFIIKGKKKSTSFTQKGIGHHVISRYTCPMHPEVESETSGKCPKCRMNLEKQ